MLKYKYIAVDFDGTIVDEAFPEFGKLKPHVVRVMKRIKKEGGQIAIWTARNNTFDEKVKRFLIDNEIPFDTYNDHFEDLKKQFNHEVVGASRKIYAQVYIDDRGFGVRDRNIDWLEVEQWLFEEEDN